MNILVTTVFTVLFVRSMAYNPVLLILPVLYIWASYVNHLYFCNSSSVFGALVYVCTVEIKLLHFGLRYDSVHARFEDPPQRYSNNDWRTANWKCCPSCTWQKEKEEVKVQHIIQCDCINRTHTWHHISKIL